MFTFASLANMKWKVSVSRFLILAAIMTALSDRKRKQNPGMVVTILKANRDNAAW